MPGPNGLNRYAEALNTQTEARLATITVWALLSGDWWLWFLQAATAHVGMQAATPALPLGINCRQSIWVEPAGKKSIRCRRTGSFPT